MPEPITTPAPLERIIVYGNPDKPRLGPVLQQLAHWCGVNGVRLWIEGSLARIAGEATSGGPRNHISIFAADKDRESVMPERAGALVVCLGGDGTLLHAVRKLWPLNGTPVLAVHLGSLSFNAAVEAGQLIQGLECWQRGEATLSERLVLSVRVEIGGQEQLRSYALNDVVLAKRSEARIIHVHLRQGDEDVFGYAGDGVIISTATGSTAYNLSAGGPILFPTLRAVVVTAMCPHTLALRPVVLHPTPKLELKFIPHHGRELSMVYIDGQEAQELAPGDRVEIEAAQEPLRLVQLLGIGYFERLREKMHWGGDLYSPGGEEK